MGIRMICAVLLVVPLLSATAHARDFTFAGFGGGLQDTYRKVYWQPFAKQEKITFLEDINSYGWAPFEAMSSTGIIKWDVVEVETTESRRGCAEGLFVKLDWSRIGDRSGYAPDTTSDCGVGLIIAAAGVAYNNDTIGSKKPQAAADFFDFATWPGRRAIWNTPKGNLEFALIADGVELNNVYKELAAPGGIDRAFKKLDELKGQVQFWDTGAQPVNWLASGDVIMAYAYNGRVSAAQAEGKPIEFVWNQFVYNVDEWVILAGTEHLDTAYDFLKFYNDPKRQAEFAMEFAYGVPRLDAQELLTAEQVKDLPMGDKLKRGVSDASEEGYKFWDDHIDEATTRWTAWATGM